MTSHTIPMTEMRVDEKAAYRISGPTQICFSGGRTSSYLLHELLDVNGGLPSDCHVVFTNTGKEVEATLEFIEEVSHRFGVKIIWLEWDGFIPPGRSACNVRVVDFATANRSGGPFERLIDALGYLPNPTQRLCTGHLKIKASQAYMKSLSYSQWDNIIGIRYDEPRRYARLNAPGRDNSAGDPRMPLFTARITKQDIAAFWRRMPFDLKLHNDHGNTPKGNCDLCFLKGQHQILSLIREQPALADWWIRQEQKIEFAETAHGQCGLFRNDRPSYAAMAQFAQAQTEMYAYGDEPLIDCLCGD